MVFRHVLNMYHTSAGGNSEKWVMGFLEVFLFCGKPAADVPFLFVHVQDLPHFAGQFRVDLHQAVHHVFVYRAFAYTKFFSGLSYSCFGVNNIMSDF